VGQDVTFLMSEIFGGIQSLLNNLIVGKTSLLAAQSILFFLRRPVQDLASFGFCKGYPIPDGSFVQGLAGIAEAHWMYQAGWVRWREFVAHTEL
jgi:hypothetical protein